MAPFAKFIRQGLVLFLQGVILQILQALMHKIERAVDQLSRLFRGHGVA
jgi:hypothetical protein